MGPQQCLDRRNDLVEANIPLIRSVARQVHRKLPPSFELDDLIQSGVLGLIQAAESYDPAGGASFATFARYRIHGAIQDSIRRDQFTESIHAELPASGVVYVDPIEEMIAAREEADQVARAVDQLPDRGRKVIQMRYSDQMSMVNVGAALGVKKTRAVQIHQQAIGLLQDQLHKAA
jgi:RNA polymerase sigma factor for flagellar operon FliA